MAKIVAIPIAIIMAFTSLFTPCKGEGADTENWNTDYAYVYVHGLSGWGSYDAAYKIMPYWGMFGGNLLKKLNKKGFDCYAASVAPSSSAWDRACELYAQLTGTVVDYGKAHSERCGHERFGEDFTGRPLIDEWNAENKINLLGHSFGGATVRLLASLMAKGNTAEIEASSNEDISPLFTGGKESWIYSITSLAAPHNGTTAYGFENSMPDNTDTAAYDMFIDHALKLNEEIYTGNETYYFSIACSSTTQNEDGTHSCNNNLTEILFQSSANEMGTLTGVTSGGYTVDESWLENDGLVNTVSAKAPSSAPSADFDMNNIEKGIWYIMPTYIGDHMSLQGGLMKVNTDVERLYTEHMNMINSL